MRKRYFILAFLIVQCSQEQKDKGIKQMIAAQAKQEVAFAAVDYSVAGGVVTLTGTCATEEERSELETKAGQTAGVKSVVNQIVVAPVVLTGEHLLKRSVDSVLMAYPSVNGTVADSVVHLHGQADRKTAEKIVKGLQELQPRSVDNQLKIAD